MPICPVHQTEMRKGNYGYFCAEFVGVGEQGANNKGYCDQVIKDQRQARPAPSPAVPGAAPAPAASPIAPRLQAAQAAIQAACALRAGTQMPIQMVMNDAATIYHDFLKPAVTGDVPLAFARPDEDPSIPF